MSQLSTNDSGVDAGPVLSSPLKNRLRDKAELLNEINSDLPPNVDWRSGAIKYLKSVFEHQNRAAVEHYSLTKPLGLIPAQDAASAITEVVGYLRNFTETVALLQLPGGSKILDVACGGGWFSHWLTRMNYQTFGFDICGDFIELARRRLREDRILDLPPKRCEEMFAVHDIESTALPEHMTATFDAAVLESCLHHFFDPIAALTHIAKALKDDGLMVIIEGENRKGPIKDEYMAVMRAYDTLERPYSRAQLLEALAIAGLPAVEFMAPVPGWISVNDPLQPRLLEHHTNIADGMNLCLAAKNRQALRRVFAWR